MTVRRVLGLTLIAVALVAPAGCDSGSDDDSDAPARERSAGPREESGGLQSEEGRSIRSWLTAVKREQYGRAAGFFAPGAVIDQGVPYRLPDRAAARTFSAGLPCRADLVELRDQGERVLASFRLRRGPGGPCSGIVRVRFRFDADGRVTEWRQLAGEELRPGQPV